MLVTNTAFPPEMLALIERRYSVKCCPTLKPSDVGMTSSEVDAVEAVLLFAWHERLNVVELKATFPSVRVLSNVGAGVDHINIEACSELGVKVRRVLGK